MRYKVVGRTKGIFPKKVLETTVSWQYLLSAVSEAKKAGASVVVIELGGG